MDLLKMLLGKGIGRMMVKTWNWPHDVEGKPGSRMQSTRDAKKRNRQKRTARKAKRGY